MNMCCMQIGLECQLSVEDLAYEVQQTFAQAELEQQDSLMYSAAMATI